MNNSQSISVLFGIIVGIISLTTALLLGVSDAEKLLTAGIISIFSSTLLFAIITENLFDKKIKEIYKSFERIRNQEFERVQVDTSILRNINPLRGINEEIYNYASLKGHGTSLPDKNVFYQLAQEPNINATDYIFRAEDPNFGFKTNPEMLLISGLKPNTLKAFQNQIEQNHGPKTLYFGDVKTAVAKEDGVTQYEVVYIEMKDPMVNNLGKAVAKEITLREDVAKPLLGPAGDDVYITADAEEYNVTTTDGLSFSISGSKVRFANELTADLGTVAKLFPNAVANMLSLIHISEPTRPY